MKSRKAVASRILALSALAMLTACAGSLDSTSGASGLSAGICRPEAGFSTEGSAAQLVERAIDNARSSIRLAGYTFTSPDIVRRLIAARQRGVDIAVVVDERGNHSAASKAAMNLLVNAGIPVRTIRLYAIHHDKYMVLDDTNVETGSFNYSAAAATRNSENVLVLWNCAQIAQAYLAHWQSRWEQGQAWQSTY